MTKKNKARTQNLKSLLASEKSDIDELRKRDYNIYKSCVVTAYTNDIENNRDAKITNDKLSILITLSQQLELSQEEIKLINYLIIPPEKISIDNVINQLKNIGVIFYSRKHNLIYVADEVVRVLRKIRKKQIYLPLFSNEWFAPCHLATLIFDSTIGEILCVSELCLDEGEIPCNLV